VAAEQSVGQSPTFIGHRTNRRYPKSIVHQNAPRTMHHAPCTTHHAPRTIHHVPTTNYQLPKMITRPSIQKVLDAARVEEVIGDYVSLKKRGANLLGLCPFHNEKTGSFTVSPAKGLYKCFGCGKAGGAVQFIMDHNNVGFADAVRTLARKYHIELVETEQTEEVVAERQRVESLYIINEFAKKFYEDQLWQTEQGRSIGQAYFKERGFTEETIRKFSLGYAPNGHAGLGKTALAAGYDKQLLQDLGLVKDTGRDFFYDRVMFTIHSLSGKVAAFAGRQLIKNDKSPKYVNSPETEIYTKSKLVYGIYQARQSIAKLDECLLVEGYTDVLSLAQSGIENVVASSGTALTTDQLRLIKRFTPNLTIIYDGDSAGIKAALRGNEIALAEDLNVKLVLLPSAEDPDSFMRNVGAEAFRTYIKEKGQDIIQFKTQFLIKEAGDDPIKRSKMVTDLVNTMALVKNNVQRSIYVQDVQRLTGVSEAILVGEINKRIREQLQKDSNARDREMARVEGDQPGASATASNAPQTDETADQTPKIERISTRHEYQERDIARVLVQFAGVKADTEGRTIGMILLQQIEQVHQYIEHPAYKKIVLAGREHLKLAQGLDTSFFINHPDEEIVRASSDLLVTPWDFSPSWAEKGIFLHSQPMPDDNFIVDSTQAIKRFVLRKIETMLQQNSDTLKTATTDAEIDKTLRIRQKLMELRNGIALELGTIIL
jgi:DNA primase